MHASAPCGTTDTLLWSLRPFLVSTRREKTNTPEGVDVVAAAGVVWNKEKADVSFNAPQRVRDYSSPPVSWFLISSWSCDTTPCLWMAPANRGRLADGPLHLPGWMRPDWRRFLGLVHMSVLALCDWVHTKLLVTLIPEQTFAPCWISEASHSLVWVMPLWAAHIYQSMMLCDTFCVLNSEPYVITLLFSSISVTLESFYWEKTQLLKWYPYWLKTTVPPWPEIFSA